MQLYIATEANDQQRKALVNIMSGLAKGERPFAIFATTLKIILDPQFVDIIATINGKNSSLSVPDVMNVQLDEVE